MTTTTTRASAFATLGYPLLSTATAEDALAGGGLAGWNVRKLPLTATDADGAKFTVPNEYALTFDNPRTGKPQPLGVVGSRYTPLQNEEQIDFLNVLRDEAGATFETAGWARGGRQTFVTMKLPGHHKVGGVDVLDNYLTSINSHDGRRSHRLLVSPLRFACMNMLNIATAKHTGLITVRHTKGARARLEAEARVMLDWGYDYLDEFNEMAERMVNTKLTQREFEKITAVEFGADEDAPAAFINRAEDRLALLAELFADAGTQANIRETVWAGFNALTEWADHYYPTRSAQPDEVRAERALLKPRFKNQAYELMAGLVR